MKIRTFFLTALFALCFWQTATPAHAQVVSKVLVLYDLPANSPYQKLGFADAIMLRNLLGHFDTNVTLQPVQNYAANQLGAYDTVFYLGAIYDNPIPATLKTDIMNNQVSAAPKTVVWFKYNLWQLAWDTAYTFQQTTGINFLDLRGMNSTPSNTNQTPGFYDTVNYKGKGLVKYYAYNSATNTANADPDIGATSINNPAKAQALVTITNSKNGSVLPYVTRSGKFWYFADLPFSYIGPRDRYLVLADLLHDIIGQNHAEQHRALVRLEDVGANVDQTAMNTLTDYMFAQNPTIPFAIATIPRYRDPNGVYNGGVAENIPMGWATNLTDALDYAVARGGQIVQHGYTHQSDTMVNNISGVSGDDYEFWNIVSNTPMTGDSQAWATNRMNLGSTMLANNGYTPFAWEAPHYHSSPFSMRAAAAKYKTIYGRAVYFTSDTPVLNGTASPDYGVGQVFPYVIKNDYYGQRVIPESLGNLEYASVCTYCLNYTADDIITNASYVKVVRDGYASFFFHPFYLEPDAGVPGFDDFQKIIVNIRNLGFTWSSPKDAQ